MTTREYILSDASLAMEEFNIKNRLSAKCVINLEQYKRPIRAKILRNHLSSSEIPSEYVLRLLEDKSYMPIIDHKNFNPRIIEAFINSKVWDTCSPEEFPKVLVSFFNRPLDVWNFAYNGLSTLCKNILLVLSTMGVYSEIGALYDAVKRFSKSSDLNFNEDEWQDSLKILHDCFISSSKMGNFLVISFHNPSIFDFMVARIEKLPNTIKDLLGSLHFSEQCYRLFTDVPNKSTGYKGKINLDRDYEPILFSTFERMLTEQKCCGITKFYNGSQEKDIFDKVNFLCNLSIEFPNFCKRTHFIESHLLLEDLYNSREFSSECNLLKFIDWERVPFTKLEALDILYDETIPLYCYVDYIETYNYLVGNFAASSEFLEELSSSCEADIDNADSYPDFDDIRFNISSLEELIPSWNSSSMINKLDDKISEYSDSIDGQIERYIDEANENSFYTEDDPNIDENNIIINEMESLRDEI